MLPVLILLVVFVALMVTLTVVAMRLAGRALGATIARRVEAAEYIQRTGQVPPAWIAATPGSSAADTRRIHADVLKRLDDLCSYYERARVPEDAGMHAVLLSRLRGVRAEWENRDIESLLS